MAGMRVGYFGLEFPMGRTPGARVRAVGVDFGPSGVTLDADLAPYAVMLRVPGHSVWGGLGRDRVYEPLAVHLVASDGEDEPYSWRIVKTYQGRKETANKALLEAQNRAAFLVAQGRGKALDAWMPKPAAPEPKPEPKPEPRSVINEFSSATEDEKPQDVATVEIDVKYWPNTLGFLGISIASAEYSDDDGAGNGHREKAHVMAAGKMITIRLGDDNDDMLFSIDVADLIRAALTARKAVRAK